MIDIVAKKIANIIIKKKLCLSEYDLKQRYDLSDEVINFMFGNYRNLGLKLNDDFCLTKAD